MLSFPLTFLQLSVYVISLIRRLHAAPPVVLFTDDERQQLAVFTLSVTDGTDREPAQLAVL